jgi:CheY-like chemotaxis protein/prolyl-tRNA editing enzyme YbaK/EbsC (Cys-tRNA(Pro) deacylase)
MSAPRWLERIIDYYGVPFERHDHAPVHCASKLAHAEHVSGYQVIKPVFLKQNGRPVTVVLPSCERVDIAAAEGVLGGARLRLASEAEIAGWFKNCAAGAVPPLRLRSDQVMLMDRSVAQLKRIYFAAGNADTAISMRFRDWWRMVRPGVGHFSTQRAAPQTPSQVLVVEDESDMNNLLCQLLERDGFECRGVTDGTEALKMVSDRRPSAVLLDLMLPDISGFEVFSRMRARSLRTPPVIVVSALDDDISRQRCHELGADAYLSKPFSPHTLVEEVVAALADDRV